MKKKKGTISKAKKQAMDWKKVPVKRVTLKK